MTAPHNPWLRATQRPSVFALIGVGDYIALLTVGAVCAPEPCLLCRTQSLATNHNARHPHASCNDSALRQ